MKRFSSLAALFLCLPLRAAPSPVEEALYARGLEDFRRARYVESLESFTELLYLNPSTAFGEKARRHIWEITSLLKEESSRWKLSDEERRRAVQLALSQRQDRDRRRRELLAELEVVRKKTEGDPAALVEALRRSRLLADADGVSAARGLEELQAAQYLDAIRAALKAQSQEGMDDAAAVHEARGFLWLYEGDLENAVVEWENALKLRPGDALLKERIEKARGGLEEQKRREEVRHHVAQAKSYFEVGDDERAKQEASRALALAPKDAEALRLRDLAGQRIEQKRRRESVGRMLDEARQALSQGHLLDAVSLLADALGQDPTNEAARSALAEAKKKLSLKTSLAGVSPSAPPKPDAKPSSAPKRAEAEEAYTLGMARYVQDDLDQAVAFFQKALALDPGFEEAAGALQAALKEKAAR